MGCLDKREETYYLLLRLGRKLKNKNSKIKIMKITLVCIISLLGLINAKAQTADDVINKWVIAMGGKEKLASIKTVYTENELSIMNNPASGKTYAVNGKGYKSVIDFGGQNVIDCYIVN